MVNRRTGKNNSSFNLGAFLNDYANAIIGLILIFFLLLAYLFVLGPKFAAVKLVIEEDIARQRQLRQMSERKLADLKAVVSLYEKINPADLQKFNRVLPDPYQRETLFGELEEIASRGGWMIDSIGLSSPDDGAAEGEEEGAAVNSADSRLKTLNVSLIVGMIDYAGLKNFLRLIESNLRLFDIVSVDFQPSEGRAYLELQTYYYQSIP